MNKDTNKANGIPEGVRRKLNWKRVDARTLHETLGVGYDFSEWIKVRIKRYGLVEGKDYEVYFKPKKNHSGNSKEYLLSPEAAESLTAVHGSRKHLRRYMISTFKFNGRILNVFRYNGELWFFGVDICNLLKTTTSCLSNMKKRCFDNMKIEGQMTVITILPPRLVPAPYTVFNEWGLLCFVYRTKRNEAMEISEWLVKEALPQIRKAYTAPHSMLDRFRQFIKSLRKQPEILPLCDRPGFPINLPAKEAQDEWA
jgi:prophage antirepressor-like protein